MITDGWLFRDQLKIIAKGAADNGPKGNRRKGPWAWSSHPHQPEKSLCYCELRNMLRDDFVGVLTPVHKEKTKIRFLLVS